MLETDAMMNKIGTAMAIFFPVLMTGSRSA